MPAVAASRVLIGNSTSAYPSSRMRSRGSGGGRPPPAGAAGLAERHLRGFY